jgi:transcription termination factor Rho
VSAAQVKRCELVPGDRISGPRRPPRRSERFASLIRIDTINGRPADEVADSTRFEDLPAAFPSERFRLGSDDPTIKAIEWLTPFGQGSRVTIAGPARSGKTEALRRLAATLAEHPDIQVSLVLAGVRPEEIAEWQQGPLAPAATVSFAASADAQAQTAERVVDQARRLAARGSHAVVLIDTLGGMQPHAARKLLASARNVAGGGSLTVIATAPEPLGGETTVIALDPLLASTGRYPAVDLLASWTIRAELLVGDAGAEAIARARMEAVEG